MTSGKPGSRVYKLVRFLPIDAKNGGGGVKTFEQLTSSKLRGIASRYSEINTVDDSITPMKWFRGGDEKIM